VQGGSGEILKVSVRHGCSPNARQMRCTLVGEIPTRRASSRLDQCVAPSGTSSKVRITTSSTWASVMVRGTPGRGLSPSLSSRPARNRARHLVAVLRLTPSRAATARLLPPCAQASTIRARNARPCAVLRRLAQFSNVCRSSSDKHQRRQPGIWHLPSTPHDGSPCHHRPSDLKRNTSQVVMGELKTGTLGGGREYRPGWWPADTALLIHWVLLDPQQVGRPAVTAPPHPARGPAGPADPRAGPRRGDLRLPGHDCAGQGGRRRALVSAPHHGGEHLPRQQARRRPPCISPPDTSR
jgi:hypothetical protein